MTTLDQLTIGSTSKVVGLLSVRMGEEQNNSVMCLIPGHTVTILRNQWGAVHFRVNETGQELVASYYAIRHVLVSKISDSYDR